MKLVYRIVTGVALAGALVVFVGLISSTPVAAAEFKITICHATGSEGHYVDITTSVNSASGVPDGSAEFYDSLAQSGHFAAAGQPVHTRSWGGHDFWIPDPDATADDCKAAAPPPKP